MGTRERRARERALRRERIIDAAADLFLEKGFSSTGVAAIADRAELNVATLYYYYSSKEIVYLAVLVRALGILIPKLATAAEEPGTARERLGRVAHTYRDFFTEHPEAQAIIHCLQSGLIEPNGDEEAALVSKAYQGTGDCIAVVAQIIRSGTEAGEFRSLDTRESTLFFWASLSGVLQVADNKSLFRDSGDGDLLDRWVGQMTRGLDARTD